MGFADALHDPAEDKRIGNKLIVDMAEALVLRGVEPEDLGRIARLKINSSDYQAMMKNGDNEAEIHDLRSIKLSADWYEDPKWPVIQAAKPVRIARVKPRTTTSAVRRTVIYPDQQYGYRRVDGELIPTHDPDAIAAANMVAAAVKPDRIVNLGDLLDFPEFSLKFASTPEFVETAQPAIDEAYRDLSIQRSIAEEVDVLEGNHDDRLAQSVLANAKAALRLRQAATTPDDWPVLSVPNLLRLDELGVRYHDGYPAGSTKVATGTDELTPLYAIHERGLDVVKTAKQSRQSFVQGHIHRVSTHTETFEVDGRPIIVGVYSPGCLCRIDGAVPSTKGAKTSRRHVTRWESWQQGVAIVTEFENGEWVYEQVPIHRGRALWGTRAFDAA